MKLFYAVSVICSNPRKLRADAEPDRKGHGVAFEQLFGARVLYREGIHRSRS